MYQGVDDFGKTKISGPQNRGTHISTDFVEIFPHIALA
jgi:hypothetical protein